ncbi:MAG: succinyl-diaminopimelate desuccinylase [Rhodospirillales bacterium]|nr:succinyl-diaminopimelate desuccinylase [Rhodospirillales bacterium]
MTIDPLNLSQALIKCPSVTPDSGEALDVLQDILSEMGFRCEQVNFSAADTPDVNNLYAKFGHSSPNFCFAGHTDVVPVGDLEAWTVDPFGAEIKKGMLCGRGASDMKTAIACFVAAVSRFIDTRDNNFKGSISLLITGDEEGPAINGTKKLLEWITEKGDVLDACLVGEPTNPNELGDMIKIGRRGSLNGYLTVSGTQGHTAYPHLADNPIHLIVKMLETITTKELDQGTDHFQASTIQVSTIDVDNPATNVIPAKARATFNVRFNDLHKATDIERWLREQFDMVTNQTDSSYDLITKVSGEAFLSPPGQLSAVLSGAVTEVTGRIPVLSTSGGTSDARFIKDYCPVAEFGMVGATMHKIDESVKLVDLEALTAIYTTTLKNYFGVN